MSLGCDGGWTGLCYQRGEQITMTAGAVPSSRDVISETPHKHFSVRFYMPLYSSIIDVFVSSNVFHFNAVLSVCGAVKNFDE